MRRRRIYPQRNSWVVVQNEFIGQYSGLFADYIHPPAEGYKLMAQTWFDAVTRRR